MGLFSSKEVVILKESSNAKDYLLKLESLRERAPKDTKIYREIDKEISLIKAGIVGEDTILFELKNSGMDLVVLHDIMLKAPSGNTAQIDFYVITPYVNIIIECKNIFGNIEINTKGDFIRTVSYGGKTYKEGIYSPITQNERHLQVLKECKIEGKGIVYRSSAALYFNDYHRSLVVLANPKTVVNDRCATKEVRSQVIRADQLIGKIKEIDASVSKGSFKTSLKEMISNGEAMLERNADVQKDYSEKYETWLQELETSGNLEVKEGTIERPEPSAAAENRSCPRCGGALVLRTARTGEHAGERFWGCVNYPKCRYHEYQTQRH